MKGNIKFKAVYSFKCLIVCYIINLNIKFDFEKSRKFSQESLEIFLSNICGNPEFLYIMHIKWRYSKISVIFYY